MDITKYRKLIVALGAAIGVLVAVSADGTVDTSDAIEAVVAFLGALGVYTVPNTPLEQ